MKACAPGRSATRRSTPGPSACSGRGMIGASIIGGRDAEFSGRGARRHLRFPVLLQSAREERPLERREGPSPSEQAVHVLVPVPADERDLEPLVPDGVPVGAGQPEDTVRAFFAMASTSFALGSWNSR